MHNTREDTRRSLRPGEDGWRTPTIEDAHHPANQRHGANRYESQFARQFDGIHHRRRSLQLHSVQEDTIEEAAPEPDPQRLPMRERVKHVTWAWFTMSMATGGIANVICQGL